MKKILRPYQQELIDGIFEKIKIVCIFAKSKHYRQENISRNTNRETLNSSSALFGVFSFFLIL